jgi:hypothetical protein
MSSGNEVCECGTTINRSNFTISARDSKCITDMRVFAVINFRWRINVIVATGYPGGIISHDVVARQLPERDPREHNEGKKKNPFDFLHTSFVLMIMLRV